MVGIKIYWSADYRLLWWGLKFILVQTNVGLVLFVVPKVGLNSDYDDFSLKIFFWELWFKLKK